MIVSEHVNKSHTAFEKPSPNHVIINFDDIKNIDLDLLTINKKCMKNANTVSYEIKYITMQNINVQNIGEEVPLCHRFSDVDRYFIEENKNKYLVFALTENNKEEVLEQYKKLCSEIKKQVKTINNGKSIKYKNNFVKMKVDSNDDLRLNKMLYIPVLDIIVESVLQTENEYNPQIHIDECEYECE